MRITPEVKKFIEKHKLLIAGNKFKELYACAREELDLYQIIEVMLIMTESGVFEDELQFNL